MVCLLAVLLFCGVMPVTAETNATPTITPSQSDAGFVDEPVDFAPEPALNVSSRSSEWAEAQKNINETMMGAIDLLKIVFIVFTLVGVMGIIIPLIAGTRNPDPRETRESYGGDRNIERARGELERAGVIPPQSQNPATEDLLSETPPVERSRWEVLEISDESNSSSKSEERNQQQRRNIEVHDDTNN